MKKKENNTKDSKAAQMSLDFSKPQGNRQRTAEVVSIARQKAIAVRDVLIRDLIATKTPAPESKKK